MIHIKQQQCQNNDTDSLQPQPLHNPQTISNQKQNPKTNKTAQQAVKTGSEEWIMNYREQERQRYLYPQRQWTYELEDGMKVCVAPLGKRQGNAKPREHILLKKERPPYITILSLVRDAAARLPLGVGTRADICELLKES